MAFKISLSQFLIESRRVFSFRKRSPSVHLANGIAFLFYCLIVVLVLKKAVLERYSGQFSDESGNIVMAWLVTRGYKLYSEIFNHHMPLDVMGSWVIARLFPGNDPAPYRFIAPVCYLLASVSFLVAPVARLKLTMRDRWLASSLFLLLVSFWKWHWMGNMALVDAIWGSFFVIFINLLGIPFLLLMHQSDEAIQWAALVGGFALSFCVFGALIAIYPIGAFILFCLVFMGLNWRFYKSKINVIKKISQIAALGFCIGAGIQVLWVFLYADLTSWYEQAILFNFQVYAKAMGNPTVFGMFKSSALEVFSFRNNPNNWELLGLVALSYLLGSALIEEKSEIVDSWSRWIFDRLLILSGLLFVFIMLGLRGTINFHSSPLNLFGITCLSWAFAMMKLKLEYPKYFGEMIRFGYLIACFVTLVQATQFKSTSKAEFMPELQKTAYYIQQNTSSQDKIAVFTLLPILYFLSNRDSAYNGISFLPWFGEWETLKNDPRTCTMLKKNRPKIIYRDGGTPWGTSWDIYGKCIDEFIASNYSENNQFTNIYELDPAKERPELYD